MPEATPVNELKTAELYRRGIPHLCTDLHNHSIKSGATSDHKHKKSIEHRTVQGCTIATKQNEDDL
jgi:hypothetical protein